MKCNGGSGLLRDLPLVEKILRKVRAAIGIPLTCKFRAGWNDKELIYTNSQRSPKIADWRPSRFIRAHANKGIAENRTGRVSLR